MHIFLLHQVATLALVILLCGEACQPVLVDVDAQWIDRREGHIDAQIKLVAINQQGFANIPTDDHWCALWDVVDVFGDEDAFSLR